MTGRGRGWMRNESTDLRQPRIISEMNSKPESMKNEHFTKVFNMIEKIKVGDGCISGPDLHEIKSTFIDLLKSHEFRDIFDALRDRALDNRQFGVKFAMTFSANTILTLETDIEEFQTVRQLFLSTLQNTHEDRHELFVGNISRFRNAVSLHGEIYNRFRIVDKPFKLLGMALLKYLQILLGTSETEESDIELVLYQISINGKYIYEAKEEGLEDFLELLRVALIEYNLNPRCRAILLFILDLNHHQYNLPENLRKSYSKLLDIQRYTYHHNILKYLNNSFEANNSKSIPSINEGTPNIDSVKSSMRALRMDANKSQVTLVKAKENGNTLTNTGSAPVPRAIRGSGVNNQKNFNKLPREKRDKLTDEQFWSSKPNGSMKVWDHDDRFKKDYN